MSHCAVPLHPHRAWAWLRRWAAALALLPLMLLGSTAAAAEASAWLHPDGRPKAAALQALALLEDAASHGLRPEDYAAGTLRPTLEQAARLGLAPPADARLAQALDASMQRYLSDLGDGRVDPRRLQQDFAPARREPFNAAALLQAALSTGTPADAARQAAPTVPQYQQLRQTLATYRALADHPAWQSPLPPLPTAPSLPVVAGLKLSKARAAPPKLSPAQAYAGLAMLASRLQALGDLPPDVPVPAVYDGPLVDALRAFQRRHGLADDGVIGAATRAALQVPPAARARQIELALERLRWTPLLQGPRMVVINIPEFVLRAYEVVDGRPLVRQQMKVIVGKALDTRTPLFDEDMQTIEFSPYWNVPPSIARGETVPRLRRDPGYFEREGFEFVAPGGQVLTSLTPERIDALRAGQLRIRQRPGPKNALGDIKFVFPNLQHIFLHHTPAVSLFARDRRDFSHGCIRVEQPVALASFVLQGQNDGATWPDERIRQAMAQGHSTTLKLSAPVPVLIAYGTALVKAGRIHFFNDLYGQDRLLDEALHQPRPSLPAPD
ncbi:MAG: peptidase [Burkholderiales bacterium RIFCSPHIGHO2_12_FULL_69_20]|nr:MAG: peptidase [Burkholderiales bacterium RIFCSPHIGHO2_12_FULL_69_20]